MRKMTETCSLDDQEAYGIPSGRCSDIAGKRIAARVIPARDVEIECMQEAGSRPVEDMMIADFQGLTHQGSRKDTSEGHDI